MSETTSAELERALELHQSGRLEDASARYEAILAASPDHAEALHLSGLLLHQLGDPVGGLARIDRAIQVDSANPTYHYNRGVILQESGSDSEAVESYRRCLSWNGGHVSAWVNLGNLLSTHGHFGEALECHRNAARLEPGVNAHLTRIALDQRLMGDIEGALATLGGVLARDPGNEEAWSGMLFASQYEPGITRKELRRRHGRWGARFPAPESAPPASGRPPLRIGFLSPDLGNHPVGILVAPLLERLGRTGTVTTVCFNDRGGSDEFLIRNRSSVAEWHEVGPLDDDGLERRIRESALDVLIDLCGHGDQNRLRVLARKPAPLQMTWAGYTGTTGLGTIDYLISDSFHTPAGSAPDYVEKLLCLPRNYVPWEAPSYAPEPGSPPMLGNGFPTFGCFNNPTKLTSATLALWARVLEAVPGAKLLLKYKGMQDPAVMNRITGLLCVHGVAPERVGFMGQTNHREHLAAFSQVDVALDPTPYSGGISTREAIWMGVPVVTLPGDTFASRHSLSHLSNAGVADTVAADETDYVRIASELVADPAALDQRRRRMRGVIAASPLLDLDGFVRDFLVAMESVTGRRRAG